MVSDSVPVPVPAEPERKHRRRHPHLQRKRKSAKRWCPFCKKHRAARARPKGVFEILLLAALIRPFMCRHCRVRHYGAIFWDRLSFDPIRFKTVLAISIWLVLGYKLLMYIFKSTES